MLGRRGWLAGLALVLACGQDGFGLLPGTPKLTYPMLSIEAHGIGDEGASMFFTIDTEGRFHSDSHGDIGNGTMHFRRCDGSLGREQVAAAFAEIRLDRLAPKSQTFKDPSNPRQYTQLRYRLDLQQELYPVDDAEFRRLEALVLDLSAKAASSQAKCEERLDQKRDD